MLLTRLAPPASPARLLRRPRVETLLATALEHPLTLLIAPPGAGKTIALAALAAYGGWPVAWCRALPDEDPLSFLRHLAAAFRQIASLNEPRLAAALAQPGGAQPALDLLVNDLAAGLDDDTLLVIDDYHLADAQPALRALIERLLLIQPPRLHLALAGRVEPEIASLPGARLRGELLDLGPAGLAFTPDELRALFALSGHEPPAELEHLNAEARGWALAAQIALGAPEWRAALGLRGRGPIAALDDYLIHEALNPLPAPVRELLLRGAALRRLEPGALRAVGDPAVVGPALDELRRRRLFVDTDPQGQLAYQPIFHAFLERRARQDLADWPAPHRQAADYYNARGDEESVFYHLVAAGDPSAGTALARLAPALLAAGRADRALDWVRQLPPEVRDQPALLELQATAQRQLARYDAALITYRAAEAAFAAVGNLDGRVRALRGQAEVYLDTVQPAPATDLLKRALKLLPRERAAERAALLRMQAENWANRGRADLALILEQAAFAAAERAGARAEEGGAPHTRLPSAAPPPPLAHFPPRLLLRAGRLSEARQQLESQLWAESLAENTAPARPGAHREPPLLLSLIYCLLGSGSRALAMAQRGLIEAHRAGSPLTEAIAELRLGHAFQMIGPHDLSPARQRYANALRLIQQVGVSRTRAEGYMGLALLHGHAGDLARAEADAREGLQIAAAAGDEWTAALILLALGGAAVAVGDSRAQSWLEQAHARFARGHDTYGQAVVILWEALVAMRAGQTETADRLIGELLSAVETHGYEGILVATSLFGPRDLAMVVPLLLRGRALPAHAELAQRLLRQGFPTIAADDAVDDYHPGYTLRVQMLGTFRVWRGLQEIQAREWQREKARQLFQLLLTYRGHWIQREQICAWLWPEADLEAAERQFKVTLNALNAALEPSRPPRVAPFFIRRQGLAYSFAPSYGVWIDVDEFELRVTGAAAHDEPDFARRNAQIAVQLYRGDYLAEALYDAWTTEERERLLARFLATATSYAAQVSADGDQTQSVQLCEQVLRRDRCYEEAYQVLMRAQARAGSRSQALRSYSRCVQSLRDELGIEPLPETVALYERLKRNEGI